jgi:hypothetical protein
MSIGVVLIAVGVYFAIAKYGNSDAGVQAFKINVTGQSWLILVLAGAAMIGVAWYLDGDHGDDAKQPAGDLDVTIAPEASFEIEHADEPYTFGDDGDFDALWLSCESGAMQACDDLYQDTPVGSEYEFFGATCGLRFVDDPPEFCIDAPVDDSLGDESLDAVLDESSA